MTAKAPFKQDHLASMIAAARKAGLPIKEMILRGGEVVLVTGEGGKPEASEPQDLNEWKRQKEAAQ